MYARSSGVIAAGVVVGCLTLALFLGRPSAAEPAAKAADKPAAPGEPGRYQVTGYANNGGVPYLFLLDTRTGKVWTNVAQEVGDRKGGFRYHWKEMIEPPSSPKKKTR